jgi:hypothetical protein
MCQIIDQHEEWLLLSVKVLHHPISNQCCYKYGNHIIAIKAVLEEESQAHAEVEANGRVPDYVEKERKGDDRKHDQDELDLVRVHVGYNLRKRF